MESFTRATMASVIPIQAYDLLRDEQRVSMLYTLAAVLGLVGDAVHADADPALFAALGVYGRRLFPGVGLGAVHHAEPARTGSSACCCG